MKKSDFYYDLPDELIAQTPVEPRDHSRLMQIDRNTGEIQHKHFYDLLEILQPGDLLVMNDSRVLPARLYGEKVDNGTFIEFLLLEQKGDKLWEIICRPGKKAKVGVKFSFGGGRLIGEVVEVKPDGNRIVQFTCEGNFYTALEEVGQMPLPPYIHEKLKEKGVNEAYVTLHVGLGTFRPVKEDDVLQHQMHSEHYHLPQETVDMIRETKANGGRVIAVGTTSCRTLEAVATAHNGELVAEDGYTDIFIYPGYSFKVLDGLITNFHLPESTLIMLISAFLGYEKTMHAYKIAVQEKYRFFSFGDAMCILPEKSE